MLNRRNFILGGAAAATSLATPALAATGHRLHMVRERTGETFNAVYLHKKAFTKGLLVDPDAEAALHWLLRDIAAGKSAQMDRRLLFLAMRIQKRLGDAPLIVTSAYRTQATNRRVGGARSSKHITGQALDIKVDGLNTNQIAAIAREQGAGGVGRYRRRGFVHIDTGERRDWAR